jgi:hypothetical protein
MHATVCITMLSYVCTLLCLLRGALGYRMYASHPVPYTQLQRNNFCDVADLLAHNTTEIGKALSGREILLGVDANTDSIYFKMDNTTFTPVSGLMLEINQALESRGNFTFVYAVIPRTQSVTNTRLVEQLQHVDAECTTWYSDTTSRRQANIGFMMPVVDASLVLVTIQVNPTSPFDPFQFLQPYDGAVWLTVLALCVVHALLSWGIEGKFSLKPNHELFTTGVESFDAISGAGTADSSEHVSTRFLNAGFGFFFLVFGSGYTANLASYLTQRPQSAPLLASPDDAVFQGASICVQYQSSAYSTLAASSAYRRLQLVTNSTLGATIPGLMQMLREGQCDGIAMSKIDWLTHEMIAGNDPNCEFTVVGNPFIELGGNFVYLPDTKYNCTSTVERVLSYHIVNMKNDGSLSAIAEAYLTDYRTSTCPSDVSSGNPSSALTTDDMAGVFFIYLMFLGFALFYKVVEHYFLKVDKNDGDKPAVGVVADSIIDVGIEGVVETFENSQYDTVQPVAVVTGDE